MIRIDEASNKSYKEVIVDPNLRHNDKIHVSYNCEFMQSLYEDYEEFLKCISVEKIDQYSHNLSGSTSCADTGKIYVKYNDGYEWYVSIHGTKYRSGFSIIFEKEQL